MSYKETTYLSVREAAQLMGLSRMHVIRLIHAGKLPARKVGHSYVIDRNELGGVYKRITDKEKKAVNRAVERTLKEYGEVIKKLGKE